MQNKSVNLNDKKQIMKIGKWNVHIWDNSEFSFLPRYKWKWNGGNEKRLYFLWWEITMSKNHSNFK